MSKILYITDKFGVSQGYEPAFTKLLNKSGIRRNEVIVASIYNLVRDPLKKKANEGTWKFDPEKKDQIQKAFLQRISVVKPKLIVVSCPAVLGFINGWDSRAATIDKMRGGVYSVDGIPTIVVPPITAIHRQIDERLITNDEGEADKQQPYRVPQGQWILHQDWSKVGRYWAGKQRRLPPFEYSVCRTLADCIEAERFLSECILIAPDIETGCYPAIITCSGYAGLHKSGAVRTFVFPFYDEYKPMGVHWDSEDEHIQAWIIVGRINQLPAIKTFQNGLYDCSYFIRDLIPPKNCFLDSMYMWHSLYPELPKTLDFISSILLDDYQYWKDDIKGQEEDRITGDMERYWRYNALDCRNTLFNTLFMLRLLLADNPAGAAFRHNYTQRYLRFMSSLRMSMRGVKADFKRMKKHRDRLLTERDEAIALFRYMIDDEDFNINSPPQKCSLLYDVLGATPRNARGRAIGKDNKKDSPSAGAMALKLIKSEHPIFRLIIERLEDCMAPDKQLSNVFGKYDDSGRVSGGIKFFTDRFRTTYNPVGTESERYSSKGSNFWDGGNTQNIRKDYRDWIVADESQVFLDIDFSQSDDVFMAYESQDPEKIAVVESGLDGHAVNGELFFGKPYDWIVAGKRANDPLVVHPITGIRQLSKKIVHGTNFQMAAFTLYVQMGRESVVAAANLLGHPDADSWNQEKLVHLCGQLMLSYRRKYRRLSAKEYYKEIADQLKATGILANCFGVTRRFLGDPADNGTQREATAFIGQSGTASNMNRVMFEIDWGWMPERFRDAPNPWAKEKPLRMDRESHGFGFHLQVHDNFVSQLDTRHSRWKEAAHNLLYVMNRPVIIHGREVSIRAEAEVGLRWGKGMIEWDGKDPYDLDRIVTSLRTAERKAA